MDIQAFKRWRSLSPAHASAFEEAKRQWHAMKPVLGDLLRTDPKLAGRHERLLRGPNPGRRGMLGAAVGAAAVAGIAVVHPPLGLWPSPAEWSADYRTATGEQRAVVLADSVRVTLNTQTSIRRQPVGMDLITGEAAIDLPVGGKPFNVIAGAGRSMAAAGRFEVRYLEGKVCVSCLEGAVRVEHPAGRRELQARQQTIYDALAISGIADIEPVDVSAWRTGELVFKQTPLVQVVAEINRYRRGRVVLLADVKSDSAVSGRFRIAILDEALLQIQQSFDLKARSFPGGLLVLS